MGDGVVGAKHCSFVFDGVDLTNYVDQVDLNFAVAEHEVTNMGSAMEEAMPGLSSADASVKITKWGRVIDDVLGPLAISPQKKTAAIWYEDNEGGRVTYTWANQAFVTGYNISGAATGKVGSDPKFRLSGAPTRVVS